MLVVQNLHIQGHRLLLVLVTLRVHYLIGRLWRRRTDVQQRLELLRKALVGLAAEVVFLVGWLLDRLSIEVIDTIHIHLTLPRSNHNVPVVRSHLRLGVRGLEIINALKVRALLHLSDLVKIVAHIYCRELVQNVLSLDGVLSDFIWPRVYLRSERALSHILDELVLLQLV